MNGQLAGELLDLGKAIGLFDSDGNLHAGWFSDPLSKIADVFRKTDQRDALLRLLNAFLPPEQSADIPKSESWHPMLGEQTLGNAYLTVAVASVTTTFGVACEYHSGSSAGKPPLASLRAHLPVVSFNGDMNSFNGDMKAVAGRSNGPLDITLRINLGWTPANDALGLKSVVVTVSLAPFANFSNLTISLEGLDLDGSGGQDVVLDPKQLGAEAVQVIIGFIRKKLGSLVGTDSMSHLLPLLGFGDGIPQFPFGQLGDPNAINKWFSSLVQGSAGAWLGHLAGLLGSAGTISGTGPWSVELLHFGSGGSLNMTLATQTVSSTTSVLVGLQVAVPSAAPSISLVADVTLAAIPIVGAGSAAILPSASIVVSATGPSGSLVTDTSITVKSLKAGFSWNGSTLQPLLELDEVTLTVPLQPPQKYDRIDLTNADSVTAVASSTVNKTIQTLLGGTKAGSDLAVLVGLSGPHLIDPVMLVANPGRAIAAVHRAALLDNWLYMFQAIADLAGLKPSTIPGSGTRVDPWSAPLATSSGLINIALVAWNDQLSGVATDPQKLRIGLRASASQAPLSFWWASELLAFDLPAIGSGTVSLMAGQRAHFEIRPVPSIQDVAGLSIGIADFSADMAWAPGSPMAWAAGVDKVTVSFGGSSVTVPSLKFPADAAFDVAKPSAIATSLGGVAVADLELLLRLMLARASYSWGGTPGLVLTGLLGVHGALPGLPSGWPTLADPGAAGSLLSDPAAALRNWLAQIAVKVGSDGSPLLPAALDWLRTLLSNAVPTLPSDGLPSFSLSISGSGTYDDPWALPLTTGASVDADALVWLEPAGPPPNWALPLVNAAKSAVDFPSLLQIAQSLGTFVPGLRDALTKADPGLLASSIEALESYFSISDGVVTLDSQVPTDPAWTAGKTLSSAHSKQPSDPAAILQILAQIDSWAGGAASKRTVLLLGPAFSDHTIWSTLLTDGNLHGTTAAGAHFNLRVPGVDPFVVDLTGVTAVANYYTADLNDDGAGNLTSLTAQIARVVAQIQHLTAAAQVTLVGHSTAGVAARAFAAASAANTALVQGLITLGSPHTGATPPFLNDPDTADAIRVLQSIASAMPADAALDAFKHIVQALDGYLPAASKSALPVATAYPAGSFADPGSIATGGCKALALGSRLTTPLLDFLKTAVSAQASAATTPATLPAAPTHLAFGVRGHLDSLGAGGQIEVDTTIRGNAFRIALQPGAADPPHPAHALAVRMSLVNPNGWLAGASSAVAGDVRVQWAELGVDIHPDGKGGVGVDPFLGLHNVSYHGPITPSAGWSDANAKALLGAVFQTISNPPPAPATALAQLLTALTDLGIAVTDPHGGIGISADAFAAIQADAAGYLGPKLATALAGGLPGFSGTASPWTIPLGSLPLELYVSRNPWMAGIRTTTGSGGLPLAGNASLTFDGSVALPASQPKLDASFNIGALSLVWSSATNQLTAQAQPWLAPVTLIPAPTPVTLRAVLNDALPRLMFSAASSAILEGILGPGYAIGPLDSFFTSTLSSIIQPSALGNSAGTGLDSSRITQLLQAINQAAGFPAGAGLSLPGGLQLTASGSGMPADPVLLQLRGTIHSSATNSVVDFTAGVSFDQLMHPSPTGQITLTAALSGSTWTSVAVAFGATKDGVTLTVTPDPGAPIQILPAFSGLGTLATGLEALLPQALDALVKALGTPTSSPVLQVASALGIYDSTQAPLGFKARATELKALLQPNWLASFPPTGLQTRTGVIDNIATFLKSSLLAVPASEISTTGTMITWSFPLSGTAKGTIAFSLGWDASGTPQAQLNLGSVQPGGGGLAIDAKVTCVSPKVGVSASLRLLNLSNALGISSTPVLKIDENGTNFQITFYPLASASGNGPIAIDFFPPAVNIATGGTDDLINQGLIPLVADALLAATASQMPAPLWTNGPKLQDVLIGSRIAIQPTTGTGGPLVINPAIPDTTTIVTGLLSTLATGFKVAISGTLNLALVNDASRLGFRIYGKQSFKTGNYLLTLLFGAPSTWDHGMDEGVAVYLFDSVSDPLKFNPGILVAGLGLGLTGQNDAPLIGRSGFRLGGVRLYSFFAGDFGKGTFDSLGGGLELDSLGLPLSQATGPNTGGDNPVAASLLSDGGSNKAGDTQAVNPGLDVAAWYWSKPAGPGTFRILLQNSDQPLWIGVHKQFGPVYIDQIGLILNDTTSVSMVIDATVKIGALLGQVDELGVTIPLKSLTSPEKWTLDLKGIALSYDSAGVTVAGGLIKNTRDGVIEYDGMLLVQVAEFGLVAVGAYSKPSDANGGYTSIFIFAGLFIIIVVPPVLEIDALGLGMGYNRELIVPDITKIPSFILVAALKDGGALASDPMGELMQIRSSIPPKRGSFWFAAGLNGKAFGLVHITAIVYVALDNGIEIGVLGVASLALPSGSPLVSVELALKARYSSAEGVLSIQAQLTDNSFLFSPDCRLTGGFAFFMWFPKGQFVLTLGGYNPNFQVPTQFPNVPRLGFCWSLPIGATIKGGSYFALTNTCVMAGGRLELTYSISCANVWFTAYADFLLSWDPFYYNVGIGISIGASISIQVCCWFLGCCRIGITLSLSASLSLSGPPLHGTASMDLEVCSLTISFGDSHVQPNYITDWGTFATKYLYGGDAKGNAFGVHVLTGLLPPEPSGAQPAPGTQDKPWKFSSEFSFQCDTKMPATGYTDFVFRLFQDQSANVHPIDLAPMHKEGVVSKMVVDLFAWNGKGWDPVLHLDPAHWTITPTIGRVSEAIWSWHDPTNMPAAANTLPALTSLYIKGFAIAEKQSALIPIAKLVDSGNSRPLPFSVPWQPAVLKSYGAQAQVLATLAAGTSSSATFTIAQQILSGDGVFAQMRANSGLPAAGLTPLALRALNLRSAPPLLTPLTTGLTMEPPALPNPPVIAVIPAVLPVVMEVPRLRAVMLNPPQPVSDAPVPVQTTVTNVSPAIPRTAPPRASAVGASLITVAGPQAVPPTTIAQTRTVRSADLGWTSGVAHLNELTTVHQNMATLGVAVPAGATHLWDVPAGVPLELAMRGTAAFRVVFLTRGGSVIGDTEYASADGALLSIPARCGMVAITCLGKAAIAKTAPGFGAVSLAQAPGGRLAAAGWQAGSLMQQVGPTTILGRGASLMFPRAHSPVRAKQAVSQTMVRVAETIANQSGVETWLPTSIGIVMILLDQQNSCEASNGDLSLAVDGATLSSSPIRVLGGTRRALLYDVTAVPQGASHIAVAAASVSAWRLAGVVGLAGKAQEWGVGLNGKIPEQIVPDGPLTPDGSITVRLVAVPGGKQ